MRSEGTTHRTRGLFGDGPVSRTALAAIGLFVLLGAGCGGQDSTPVGGASPEPANPPPSQDPADGAADGGVGEGAERDPRNPVECAAAASTEVLDHVAEALRSSPIDALIDVPVTGGSPLPPASSIEVGRIVGVERVDLAPYDILPVEDGGVTNEFAGNAAFWSGIRVEVDTGGARLLVSVPVVAGGADVIAAMGPQIPDINETALDSACAAVARAGRGPEGGDGVLLAISATLEDGPIPVASRFAAAVREAASMAELAG